jgi:hypothetical protein
MVSEEVTRAVKCAIQTRPGLNMDDLILACTPYTWNQVFLALNDLVRHGVVTHQHRGGFYMIPPSSNTMTSRRGNRKRHVGVRSKTRPHVQV